MELVDIKLRFWFVYEILLCPILPGLYHYVYCYVRSLKSYFLTRGRNNNRISQIY